LKSNYLLSTGAEGQGSMILNYDGFEAVVMYSKITDSFLPSEIQGEHGVIEIDKISGPEQVIIKYRDGKTEDISVKHEFDTMYYEVEEFISSVENRQIESTTNTHEISRQVVKILTM